MFIRPLRVSDCQPRCRENHVHGPSDIPALHELYVEQNFGYAEPDWTRMLGEVLADENDAPLIVLAARPTVEMYALLSKRDWATPGLKVEMFKRLDQSVVALLRRKGFEDQHSWIPPQCRSFLRRLTKLFGWVRTDGEGAFVGLVRWIA